MVSSVHTPKLKQAAPSQSAWTPRVALRARSMEKQRISCQSCALSTTHPLSQPRSGDPCLALSGAQGEQAGSQDPRRPLGNE